MRAEAASHMQRIRLDVINGVLMADDIATMRLALKAIERLARNSVKPIDDTQEDKDERPGGMH